MSYVPGNVRFLTPDEAKTYLTIPLLKILVGDAQPVFPTRNRGNWSPTVLIIPIRANQHNVLQSPLPAFVSGRQWENAVVPILQDPQWRTTEALIRQAMSQGQLDWLLETFGNALRESFRSAGYGPVYG